MELTNQEQTIFDSCDDLDQEELRALLSEGYSLEEAVAMLDI